MARPSRINRRIVNTKRHTIGFRLTGNRDVTRRQAISMARRGEIAGVRVCNGPQGPYLQSSGNRSLYSLATTVNSEGRISGSSRRR